MSGGLWDYRDGDLCCSIYSNVDYYNMAGRTLSKEIRRVDPLRDGEISELTFDVLQLLHSYDLYASGDTGEEDYRRDVANFKAKWLGVPSLDRIKAEVDTVLELAYERLYKEFGLTGDKNGKKGGAKWSDE